MFQKNGFFNFDRKSNKNHQNPIPRNQKVENRMGDSKKIQFRAPGRKRRQKWGKTKNQKSFFSHIFGGPYF